MNETCRCGSSMSNYEQQHYKGRCTACWNEDIAKAATDRQQQADLKKAQELQEKVMKEEAARQTLRDELAAINGKTVKEAYVQDWKTCFGRPVMKEAVVKFIDGTAITFTQEQESDGCRGCYEHEEYLSIYSDTDHLNVLDDDLDDCQKLIYLLTKYSNPNVGATSEELELLLLESLLRQAADRMEAMIQRLQDDLDEEEDDE